MKKPLDRTSITVDEAVAILLGWFDEPVEFTRLGGDGDDESEAPVFDIREVLAEELDFLNSDHAGAKYDRLDETVIAEKYAALQQHQQVIDRANAYLCAIEDEINKGERSALRIDTKLSNPSYTYITLTSFADWAKQYDRTVLVELQKTTGTTPPEIQPQPNVAAKPKPRMKMHEQESAILDKLSELGHDPLVLPPYVNGDKSIKAEVQTALKKSPLFKAATSFGKAWERLGKKGEIVWGNPPPYK